MKITKQLLEKRQADALDKAQLAAYKALKSNKKAEAAIYAYIYNGKKTILDKPLLKYNQDEVQTFIKGFSKGKEPSKVTVDVLYHSQLDQYEDSLRERGLIEAVEKDDEYYIKAGILGTDEKIESMTEAVEKEFDVWFSDGPTSNRSEKIIIKAKDTDEAESKAYKMPQAKQYRGLTVRERTEGETEYIVAYHYTIINSKGEEVKQPFKNEGRFVITAESEEQAKQAYNRSLLNHYFAGYSFRPGDEILPKPVPGKQCGKFGKMFDCYQGGAASGLKAKELLEEEKMIEHKFKLKEKEGKMPTVEIKNILTNQKHMNTTEAFKHLRKIRYNISEAIEPNGPIKYSFNVKKNAGEDTPQASGRNREYRNDDYYGFTDEIKKEIEELPCSKALNKIKHVINMNGDKFNANIQVWVKENPTSVPVAYDSENYKDWKLDKQFKVKEVYYSSGKKGYISRQPGIINIEIIKDIKK